jgi:hypothetical protein
MGHLKHLLFGVPMAALLWSAGAQAAPVSPLWVDNATSGAPIIQEYDLSTGALIQQITAPHGLNGRGIVTVGNDIYYTDAGDNNVYAYNYVTHTDLGTQFSVAGATALSTMAYDGTNFWIGDYSGSNHAYLYTPTGTLLKTISLANCSGHCDGLEYGQGVPTVNGGGGFLIANRGDAVGPYDIYDLNGNLLSSAFITGHSSSSTTGIAFDGTLFYVDNVESGGLIDEYNTSGTYVSTLTLTGQTYFLGEDLSVNYAAVLPPVPAPIIGKGLPSVLTVGGLLLFAFAARLWERTKKRGPLGNVPHAAA